MCKCTQAKPGPHIEAPKSGMIIGEKGFTLVLYSGDYEIAQKTGDATGIVYHFTNGKKRYIDSRDEIYILDEGIVSV